VARSSLSRHVSEFVGVALFAAAMIWLIALASYSASDPVWFFNTGSDLAPANFAGRVGAFLAELSYQTLGYAAYIVPIVFLVLGWHYFWCRMVDAAYTKLVGAALLFGCTSAFLSLVLGTVRVSGKAFRTGGYLGDWLAGAVAEYLNRTGSIILILTLLFLAVILSTQFSFGRLFAAIGQILRDRIAGLIGSFRVWREERRRNKQRQEVLKKHLDKIPKDARPESKPKIAVKTDAVEPPPARAPMRETREAQEDAAAKQPSRTAAMVCAAAEALKAAA
jgi:S-DNA-T family DNA segregation ATPase FtsK/SpoIIIE